MHPAVASIVAGIEADQEEALLGACELLRAHRIGSAGTAVLPPYDTLYASAPFGPAEVKALRDSLVGYLGQRACRNTCAAIFALGQLRDPSLVPLLRQQLAKKLDEFMTCGAALGQLIVCLNDIGEGLFDGNFSIHNIEENIGTARRYLLRHGIEEQW